MGGREWNLIDPGTSIDMDESTKIKNNLTKILQLPRMPTTRNLLCFCSKLLSVSIPHLLTPWSL